jgi:RNA polymerase sigma factor (sigma-70 family)
MDWARGVDRNGAAGKATGQRPHEPLDLRAAHGSNPAGGAWTSCVDQSRTTAAVQQYLDDLGEVEGNSPAEPLVRDLLTRALDRLHLLCARLLRREYPRLTRGPLNLQSEEVLSAVVERLLKAMRNVRPKTVRQFFALANQHMRWELNHLARRLDSGTRAAELHESWGERKRASESSIPPAPNLSRILTAIDTLAEEEREVFDLVRLQGLSHPEAAQVVGISVKTVQRRLKRSLVLLSARLGDLSP